MLRAVPIIDEESLRDWASQPFSYTREDGVVVERSAQCARAFQLSARSTGQTANAFVQLQSVEEAAHIMECFKRNRRQFVVSRHQLDEKALAYSHHKEIRAMSRQSTPTDTPRAKGGHGKTHRRSGGGSSKSSSPRCRGTPSPPLAQSSSCLASPPVADSLNWNSSEPCERESSRLLLVVLKALTAGITMDDLYWLFSQFGEVERISSFERVGHFQVLVQFARGDDARSAMGYFNGRTLQIDNACCVLAIVPSTLDRLTFQHADSRNSDFEAINAYIRAALQNGTVSALKAQNPSWAIRDFLWGSWVLGDGWLMPKQDDRYVGKVPPMEESLILAGGGAGHCIHIAGLPAMSDSGGPVDFIRVLFGICSLYGFVVSAKLLYKHEGCALVQYRDKAQADRARAMLHSVRIRGKMWDVKESKNPNATNWSSAGCELDKKMCTHTDVPQPLPQPADYSRLTCPTIRMWGVPHIPVHILRTVLCGLSGQLWRCERPGPGRWGGGSDGVYADGSAQVTLPSVEDAFFACAVLNGAELSIAAEPWHPGELRVTASAKVAGAGAEPLRVDVIAPGAQMWEQWSFVLQIHPGSDARRPLPPAPQKGWRGPVEWKKRCPDPAVDLAPVAEVPPPPPPPPPIEHDPSTPPRDEYPQQCPPAPQWDQHSQQPPGYYPPPYYPQQQQQQQQQPQQQQQYTYEQPPQHQQVYGHDVQSFCSNGTDTTQCSLAPQSSCDSVQFGQRSTAASSFQLTPGPTPQDQYYYPPRYPDGYAQPPPLNLMGQM